MIQFIRQNMFGKEPILNLNKEGGDILPLIALELNNLPHIINKRNFLFYRTKRKVYYKKRCVKELDSQIVGTR